MIPKGWKKGWKVCRTHYKNGKIRLVSCMDFIGVRAIVVYRDSSGFNRTCRPRKGNGPLAVFTDRAQAEHFICVNEWDVPKLEVHPCIFMKSIFDGLWRIRSNKRLYWPVLHVPQGTVFADAVKLVNSHEEE